MKLNNIFREKNQKLILIYKIYYLVHDYVMFKMILADI